MLISRRKNNSKKSVLKIIYCCINPIVIVLFSYLHFSIGIFVYFLIIIFPSFSTVFWSYDPWSFVRCWDNRSGIPARKPIDNSAFVAFSQLSTDWTCITFSIKLPKKINLTIPENAAHQIFPINILHLEFPATITLQIRIALRAWSIKRWVNF